MSFKHTIRIAVAGDAGVGKSLLCNKLTKDWYTDMSYILTIGVDYMIRNYPEYDTKLCFWDFAGDKRFGPITYSYLVTVDLILFVYNIHDKYSIDRLVSLYNTYTNLNWSGKLMIVGNNILGESSDERYDHYITAFIGTVDRRVPHIIANCSDNDKISAITSTIFDLFDIKQQVNTTKEAPSHDKRFGCADFSMCGLL